MNPLLKDILLLVVLSVVFGSCISVIIYFGLRKEDKKEEKLEFYHKYITLA